MDTCSDVRDLLYRLGVTANYKGFAYIAYALALCEKEPERLQLVTKWVYLDVAKRYGTNFQAVERGIRKAGEMIWERGRPELERIARRRLECKPSNAKLLAILLLHRDQSAQMDI